MSDTTPTDTVDIQTRDPPDTQTDESEEENETLFGHVEGTIFFSYDNLPQEMKDDVSIIEPVATQHCHHCHRKKKGA